jgi:hypothetical protein
MIESGPLGLTLSSSILEQVEEEKVCIQSNSQYHILLHHFATVQFHECED